MCVMYMSFGSKVRPKLLCALPCVVVQCYLFLGPDFTGSGAIFFLGGGGCYSVVECYGSVYVCYGVWLEVRHGVK